MLAEALEYHTSQSAADGGTTAAQTTGGGNDSFADAMGTSMAPAAEGGPQADDDAKPAGHYMCTSEDGCVGNRQSRLVRHVFPTGEVGDIYCDACWGVFLSKQPKLKCMKLGHPGCAQDVPGGDNDAFDNDAFTADHQCTGSPDDRLVQHVHEGKNYDTYCVNCWKGFKRKYSYGPYLMCTFVPRTA